jgi:transcriptional regulator with XRE-family HTH domain
MASKLGVSPPYLNDLIMKRRNPEDRTKRKIAAALGYPDIYYEDFLSVGRCVLKGEAIDLTKKRDSKESLLRARGVLAINYSDHLTLGEDGKIEATSTYHDTPVIVYGPSIHRATANDLQAFTFAEKNMGDVLPKNSTFVVDLSLTRVRHTDEPQLFLICLDKETRNCTVKYIDWVAEKDKILISAEDKRFKAIYCDEKDVVIVGKVILIYTVF